MKRCSGLLLAGVALLTIAPAGAQDRYWTPLLFRGDTTANYVIADGSGEYELRIEFKAVDMLDWRVSAELTSLDGRLLSLSGPIRITSPMSWASEPPPSEDQPAALRLAHYLTVEATLFDAPVDRMSWLEGFSVPHPTVPGATINVYQGRRCAFAGKSGQEVQFLIANISKSTITQLDTACVSPEAGLLLRLYSDQTSFLLMTYQETTAPWLLEMAEQLDSSPVQDADDELADLWDDLEDEHWSDELADELDADEISAALEFLTGDLSSSAPPSPSYAPFPEAHSRSLSGFQAQEKPWGRTVLLDSYEGNNRPLYLFFWKAGEPWSTAQAQAVASLRKTYSERIDFLALAASEDSALHDYQISDDSELMFYSSDEGSLTLKILVAGGDEIRRHFGVTNLPAAIVYDSRGQVVCAEKSRGALAAEGEADVSEGLAPCALTVVKLKDWDIGESP